ncbi:hypothetical protein GIV78_27380, partial [Pseudomonas sp. PA-3-6H]|nr:hypothetical protein [Pseudomonas sp. PA-3-6H]
MPPHDKDVAHPVCPCEPGGGVFSFLDPQPLRCVMKSSFWKSGHTPTLFAAFLYFDLSFM